MKEEADDQRNGKANRAKGGPRNANSNRDRSRSPHDRNISARASRRVYVANVPFDVKWSELKDLFREKVGNVVYCQLFEDEQGRSRGCGLIEFSDVASAKKAIDTLHRFEFKNRELVVKEDLDCERDRYGRLLLPGKGRLEEELSRGASAGRGGDNYDHRFVSGGPGLYDQPSAGMSTWNTYGLSPQFLDSLGIAGPLNNRIFVANLDYKVGEKKLEEIFRLAGKVLRVRLYTDSNGQSKGHGTVEFDHPVEAVQAISMFHDQKLYGRPMSIRMDKYECEDVAEVLPSKLPSGLEGIGKGLGIGGQPLNVSKSLLGASMAPPVAPPMAPTPVASGQVVVPSPSTGVPSVMGQHLSSTLGQGGHIGPQQNATPVGMTGMALDTRATGLAHQNTLGQTIGSSIAQSIGVSVAPASMVHSTGGGNNGIYSTHMASQPTGTVRGLGVQQQQPQQQPSLQGSMVANTVTGTGGGMYEREFRDPMMGTNVPPSNMGIGMMSGPLSGPRTAAPSVSDTVIVRNLPPTVSWQSLRDRFSEVGDVRYSELKGPGTALIRFGSERDAQRSVDMMNGSRFENRLIEVSFYY